jgi:chromosome segregation ATPase
VSDRPQSVQIKAFEQVEPVPGIALLRVLADQSRRRTSTSRPNLVIQDGDSTHRFAPLPAPEDARGVLRGAYSVPLDLLEHDVTFALEFQGGVPLILPRPTTGSMRQPTRDGQPASGTSDSTGVQPDADLDTEPRIDIYQQLVQQSQALAESQRAATSRDRSQRRALGKLQSELERATDALRVLGLERDELSQQVSAADSAAAKAIERATLAEKTDAESRAALEELETWRAELERRLAELTTESAATKQGSEEAEVERQRLDGERIHLEAELERLSTELDAATGRSSDAQRSAQEQSERTAEVQGRVSALEDAVAQAAEERAAQDKLHAANVAELDGLRAAQAQSHATLATLRGELQEARLHAARSDDLEREVEASRGEAERLQTAVLNLESEIRSSGHARSDPLPNGSERELVAVSSALDGAREEMNALRRELVAALASGRKANLELVMLTAETQARLQAQTELQQAAQEAGLSR